MTISQLIKILRSRWVPVAMITAGVTLLALLVSLLSAKQYVANASVLVDLRAPEMGDGRRSSLQLSAQSIMQTQVELIRSERVARHVVRGTGMLNQPALVKDWVDITGGKGDVVAYLAPALLRGLDVVPAKEASIIGIQFTDRDPVAAATLANAFAQAYIDVNLELKVDPARRAAGWFEEQRALFAGQLSLAQKKLSDLQQEKGLLSVGEGQIDVENAKLASLTAQMADLQGQRAEAQSRRQQALQIDTSAEVQNNPLIASLKAEISRTEATLKQLSEQLGSSHPTIKAAQEQLVAQKAQLNQERASVARTVGGSSEIVERRLGAVSAELDRQKQRVLAMKAGTDELVVLRRDVERAQKALDSIDVQQSQAALESRLQQNNVSIVTTAVPPLSAAKPRVLLNTVVGLLFGAMLAVGVVLILETRRPVIRDAQDVDVLLGLPVLATVSRLAPDRTPGGLLDRAPALLKLGRA